MQGEDQMTIYQDMKNAKIKYRSHESDLYVLKTPRSTEIVDSYYFKQNVRTFTNSNDGQIWYNIPFAFDPFWDRKKKKLLVKRGAQGLGGLGKRRELL